MISFWEQSSFFKYDTIIVGSGIVGLSMAASILEKDPDNRVLILERSVVLGGASTKNAGFACVGTPSETLWDLRELGREGCFNLINMRYKGLQRLRQRLGDDKIGYKQVGGHELIGEDGLHYLKELDKLNELFKPIFGGPPYEIANHKIDEFGFNKDKVKALVYNKYEGHIDTGKTISNLIQYVQKLGARILAGAEVVDYVKIDSHKVCVKVKNPLKQPETYDFHAKSLVLCTNEYSNKFIKNCGIVPGRGQVLITKPIPNLKVKGIFQFDQGFYYFRDHENRIIFGGGRNLDLEGEQTYEMKTTPKIMNNLKKLLKEVILPGVDFEIESEWAGIMAFGEKERAPLIDSLDENIFAAVRMGGMGVAISSYAGDIIAEKLLKQQKEVAVRPSL